MRFRFAGMWSIVPVTITVLLACPSATLPGDDLGLRGFVTPTLGPDATVAQTFVMTADGFRGIELFPTALDSDRSGEVRFELYELYGVGDEYRETVTRSSEVPVRDLLRAPSYTFSFAPIAQSRNRMYRLQVDAPDAASIAFWATKGERYEGGTLEFNGLARWADLAFGTDAAVPSHWALLVKFHEMHPTRAYAVMAAFGGTWMLVGFAIRKLEMLASGSGPVASPQVASTDSV
jgi:hypothetical protein